jgi:four helix bundle suffix protein
MICAIHQAVFLLKRQIESQGRRFLKEGGFAENMYRQRQKARQRRAAEKSDRSDKSDESDRSDSSDKPDAPPRNSP